MPTHEYAYTEYEYVYIDISLFFHYLIACHGKGVYTATGPTTPLIFAENCNKKKQVILAIGLNGATGTVEEEGDSWEASKDYKIFKRGEQILPCYVVHFDRYAF